MHSIRLCLILFLIHFSHQVEMQSVSDEGIQRKIDDFVKNWFLPYNKIYGLGLGIVQNNGEHFYNTGYGFSDHEAQIPNGNRTQFLLGSVSKTFTALVVVKTLHENFPELGEAVLDTPINQLIPQSNFFLNDSVRTEHATFRDLLSHKICYPRDDFSMMAESFDSKVEIFYRQRFAVESCGFRTRFMYNNIMVLWASELIGHLNNNQTFEDNAQKLLWEIGMSDSAFVSNTDDFSRMPFRAKPYYITDHKSFPINPELIKRLSNIQAIGGLYTTPNDMTRLLQFKLNLGNINGKQVIPAEVMSWFAKPSNLFPTFAFKKKNDDSVIDTLLAVGLGIMVGSYDGWQRLSHTGYFPPYQTEISMYPELNLGIFSSTHEAPFLLSQHVLHGFILETLQGREDASQRAIHLMKEEHTKAENEEKQKSILLENFLGEYKNQVPSKPNTDALSLNVVGKYKNKVTGDVEIFQKYNQQTKRLDLYLSYGKWAKGWLQNIGGEGYHIIWDTDIAQDFYAAGELYGLAVIKANGSLTIEKPYSMGMLTLGKFEREIHSTLNTHAN